MNRFVTALLISALFSLTLVVHGADPTKPFITPPAPKFTDAERHAELARRRAAVAAKMEDNSVMILFSGQPRIYTNDVDYAFRQENNLYYLTNLKQTRATLVMKKAGGKVSEMVYVPKRDPRQETWTGHMYSNEEVATISGIKTIADASEFAAFFSGVKSKSDASIGKVYLILPASDRDEDGRREYPAETAMAKDFSAGTVVNAAPIFAELRQIKSPYELKMLQHAVDISMEGHMRTWATAGNTSMEYEVQAEFEYVLRRRNADYWGYPSIVGCGPNATTLHYEDPQGPVTKGSLMLIDAAAEYDHYSADVTRTFPVSGKFTKEQAEIYQIVYDAQEAVARVAKPGATMSQLENAASAVIEDGLFRLGLIAEKGKNQHRRWYMHGFGHWIGMNVHDVGQTSTLAPGMTFTNEPGIYIREDTLTNMRDSPETQAFIAKVKPAFEKYKNIGVRIEDDMLITATGVEWMTKNLPRSIGDIEAFIASNPKVN